MSINIYCNSHESNHKVSIVDLLKLIHIYQYKLAQRAYSEPLPVTGYSNPVAVLTKTVCPLDDLDLATITPKTHSYIGDMLANRAIWSRKKG